MKNCLQQVINRLICLKRGNAIGAKDSRLGMLIRWTIWAPMQPMIGRVDGEFFWGRVKNFEKKTKTKNMTLQRCEDTLETHETQRTRAYRAELWARGGETEAEVPQSNLVLICHFFFLLYSHILCQYLIFLLRVYPLVGIFGEKCSSVH